MLIAAVAFVAAVAGVWAGRELFPSPPSPGVELHSLLHDGLELDEAQRTKLETLESRFAVRRRALELELRADNARLADAIDLALATKQAHWNLKGPQFIAVHEMLDPMRAALDGHIDVVAEAEIEIKH